MNFAAFEPQNLVGQQVDQYQVLEYLTQGGMAYVYRAHDAGLERDAALKILLPELTRDQEFIERFRREAKAAAQLRHANVVQIFATGVSNGLPYIAMEYVEGGTLDGKLAELAAGRTLFTAAHALALIRQVADGLAAAHHAGIVHRDLKPGNILLKRDGSPVVADLGIAVVHNSSRLTRHDSLMGTPDYMSPEQVRGETLDGRSDIYSLGVILYELLAMRRPFVADSPWAILHKQVYEEPAPLRQLRAGLSPLVYQIAHTCLQKDPAARFQTCQQLVAALDEALVAENAAGSVSASGVWSWRPQDTGRGYAPGSGQAMLGKPATGRRRRVTSWWLYTLIPMLVLPFVFFAWQRTSSPPAPTPVSPTAEQLVAAIPIPSPTHTPPVTSTLRPTTTETRPPTETATPASSLTASATATATRTPTRTPSATVRPSATATRVVAAAQTGSGLPLNFQNFGVWVRGNEPNGTINQSAEQARSGGYSAKLSYDFPTAGNDYVVFMQLNDIAGMPNALQVWVYGDGSRHFLNAWILDAGGQTWQAPFGQVSHTGWRQMTGYILVGQPWPWTHISGPNNGQVDYPIRFRAFVLDDHSDAYVGQGVIYLDELTATTLPLPGTGVTATPTGTVTPTSAGSTPTPTAGVTAPAGEVGRIFYTSGNTLMSTDPNWSTPVEVGTVASNSCGSVATTMTGLSFNLYRSPVCAVGGTTNVCRSPNGQHEVVVTSLDAQSVAMLVRSSGDEGEGSFVYQGTLDRSEGIRWSPLSSSFLFVVGDTVYQGFAGGGYNQIIPIAYEPIFSPDGAHILYRKPVGPGVNDVFVSNADGTSPRNVTNVQAVDKRCAAWRP
jgi:serine/threonine protein kinase